MGISESKLDTFMNSNNIAINWQQKSKLATIILVLLVLSLNLACKDEAATDPSDIVFPATNVSYGKHVQPLFNKACAFSGCHGPDTFLQRGYSLDSYENLTPGAAHELVIPGNPDNSKLIWSIEGINGYDGTRRMPMNLTPLNANQIDGMRRWIAEGARNN